MSWIVQASDRSADTVEPSLMSSCEGLTCQCAIPWLWDLIHASIQPWKPGTGVRLEACRPTAGGAGPQYAHPSEGQAMGSRLTSCTCTVAEVWETEHGSWALERGYRGRKQGGTQVVGVCEYEYLWGKTQ